MQALSLGPGDGHGGCRVPSKGGGWSVDAGWGRLYLKIILAGKLFTVSRNWLTLRSSVLHVSEKKASAGCPESKDVGNAAPLVKEETRSSPGW